VESRQLACGRRVAHPQEREDERDEERHWLVGLASDDEGGDGEVHQHKDGLEHRQVGGVGLNGYAELRQGGLHDLGRRADPAVPRRDYGREDDQGQHRPHAPGRASQRATAQPSGGRRGSVPTRWRSHYATDRQGSSHGDLRSVVGGRFYAPGCGTPSRLARVVGAAACVDTRSPNVHSTYPPPAKLAKST
jgi:hypothetical protein